MNHITVRPEIPADIPAIFNLNLLAFGQPVDKMNKYMLHEILHNKISESALTVYLILDWGRRQMIYG